MALQRQFDHDSIDEMPCIRPDPEPQVSDWSIESSNFNLPKKVLDEVLRLEESVNLAVVNASTQKTDLQSRKKELNREKNRLSAQKSREKKRKEDNDIKMINEKGKREKSKLKKEVATLEGLLRTFMVCQNHYILMCTLQPNSKRGPTISERKLWPMHSTDFGIADGTVIDLEMSTPSELFQPMQTTEQDASGNNQSPSAIQHVPPLVDQGLFDFDDLDLNTQYDGYESMLDDGNELYQTLSNNKYQEPFFSMTASDDEKSEKMPCLISNSELTESALGTGGERISQKSHTYPSKMCKDAAVVNFRETFQDLRPFLSKEDCDRYPKITLRQPTNKDQSNVWAVNKDERDPTREELNSMVKFN